IDYINICVPIYNASIRGDWKAVEPFLFRQPDLVRFGISENYDTALHIAASAKTSKLLRSFVKNLMDRMTYEDLKLQNKDYNTALCVAIAAGNFEIAMTMVNKHQALLDVSGRLNRMPFYMACLYGKKKIVKHLYQNFDTMTGIYWTEEICGKVLHNCVQADIFVFAIIHVKVGPANKPSDAMKLVRIIWNKVLTLSDAEIDDIIRGPAKIQGGVRKYTSGILFLAAKMGNTEFVVELIRQYPDILWKRNDKNRSIFHVAVKYRHQGIYSLLNEIGSMKDVIMPLKDQSGNNMLHLVGKCPKIKRLGDVSGVALHMQRELLWFKVLEVENTLPPACRESKNNARQTPRNLFSEEHKRLLFEGERWMKDTASQSMVVSALIATIVFAAAFMVPGGYNQDNGIPMFLHKRIFIVFVIADAVSLIFSSISILIFLYVHITTYSEQDFLDSLPMILMTGLVTLSISIVAMMVAFSVSFFVLYLNNLIWVPIVISVFSSGPVILLVIFHLRVLRDVYRSTYSHKYFFKTKKPSLYIRNPNF
ncbi:Ankyrin repeat-containing protein, partial [Cynara cardunculus var. scolymus]